MVQNFNTCHILLIFFLALFLGYQFLSVADAQSYGKAKKFLSYYDINADRKVTLKEISSDQARIFMALDINSDKFLSSKELRRGKRALKTFRATSLFDMLDVDGNNKLHIWELQAPSKRWFKRFDVNNNGFMEGRELPHRFKKSKRKRRSPRQLARKFVWFYDLNGDKKVSLKEILSDQSLIFSALDINNDKSLTAKEMRRRFRSLRLFRISSRFDILDWNGDKRLSLDEMLNPSQRWFNRLDVNNDGIMEPRELPRRFKKRKKRGGKRRR